jgi:hypothetical protein
MHLTQDDVNIHIFKLHKRGSFLQKQEQLLFFRKKDFYSMEFAY